MARVSRQKARKVWHCQACRAEIKPGTEYLRTRLRRQYGGVTKIRCTQHPFRSSDLTESPYLIGVYSAQEGAEDALATLDPSMPPEDLYAALTDARDELASNIGEVSDEEQEKLDNMPDGLRDGSTGESIQERYDACQEWQQEVESVPLEEFAPDDDHDEEEAAAAVEDWLESQKALIEEASQSLETY